MKSRDRSKGRAIHDTSFVEGLEPRTMLSADLAVEFADFSLPGTLVPGDTFTAGIFVSNLGPMAALGSVTIRFYLSEDVNFSAGDVLMASFDNEPIQMSSGDSGPFAGDVTVPATVVPGEYFILCRIIPNGQVGDLNQSNNIVASTDFFDVERRFGNFDGRQNVTLTLVDADGTVVEWAMSGGGSGTVEVGGDGLFAVAVTGSGTGSNITISTTGGDGVTRLVGMVITGSMNHFNAPTSRLIGAFAISGTLAALTLGDVGGGTSPASIHINLAGVETAITLGAVQNATINTVAGIASLDVTNWRDTDATVDQITAPRIVSLSSDGAFGASLRLFGAGIPAQPVLGTTDIGGAASGVWSVEGKSGPITLKTTTLAFSASFLGVVPSLTVNGTFRGLIAAKAFTTISVTAALQRAFVLAGTHLGSDGLIGGTEGDTDTFKRGSIGSLTVGGKVLRSIVGAGLDPVNGVFDDGDDVLRGGAQSRIGAITVGQTASANSRFLARRYTGAVSINGNAVDPANDRRFVLTELAAPTGVLVDVEFVFTQGPNDVYNVTVTFTDNRGVKRSSLGDFDIVIDGPGGAFTIDCFFVSAAGTGNGTSITSVYEFVPPGGTFDSSENGEYSVFIVGSQVFDTSGNAAGEDLLGTFEILV